MIVLVEAAVESLDAALAAAAGGAYRLELSTDLPHGGTTPDMNLVRACRSRLAIPIFVLVRPRADDFVYTDAEHRTMLEQIAHARAAGATGIVTGALTAQQEIDQIQTRALITAARPLPVTFHRAFDACRDLSDSLETLIRLGVARVLTTGGAPTAIDGVAEIGRLVRQSKTRIEILAGGGINAANVRPIRDAGVREIHFSVQDAEKVRQVIAAL